jgi:hypothetical protein
MLHYSEINVVLCYVLSQYRPISYNVQEVSGTAGQAGGSGNGQDRPRGCRRSPGTALKGKYHK